MNPGEYASGLYEARRKLLAERIEARRNGTVQRQSTGEVVLTPGIQCAHCNEIYEVGTMLRKCGNCGEGVCRSTHCSCPGIPDELNEGE